MGEIYVASRRLGDTRIKELSSFGGKEFNIKVGGYRLTRKNIREQESGGRGLSIYASDFYELYDGGTRKAWLAVEHSQSQESATASYKRWLKDNNL